MSISYAKLFELMKKKGYTTYQLQQKNIISQSTLQKLRTGKDVSTKSIRALCEWLDCQPGDLMEYIPENK